MVPKHPHATVLLFPLQASHVASHTHKATCHSCQISIRWMNALQERKVAQGYCCVSTDLSCIRLTCVAGAGYAASTIWFTKRSHCSAHQCHLPMLSVLSICQSMSMCSNTACFCVDADTHVKPLEVLHYCVIAVVPETMLLFIECIARHQCHHTGFLVACCFKYVCTMMLVAPIAPGTHCPKSKTARHQAISAHCIM